MNDWLAEYERSLVREYLARCPDEGCGARWLVEGQEEYGCFFLYQDDDMLCPDCGREEDFE